MIWVLIGLSSLIGGLVWVWIHDVRIYKKIAENYQQKYYDTLDFHYGNPVGTTSRRMIENCYVGSESRKKEEKRHKRMYGGE